MAFSFLIYTASKVIITVCAKYTTTKFCRSVPATVEVESRCENRNKLSDRLCSAAATGSRDATDRCLLLLYIHKQVMFTGVKHATSPRTSLTDYTPDFANPTHLALIIL